MKNLDVDSVISQCLLAGDLNKINSIVGRYLASQHIKSYAFTYYSFFPSSQRKLKYDFASPALLPWHRHYLDSQYEDTDQTLQWSKRALTPVYWDVHAQRRAAKTPREKRIREESIAFGIEKGIAFPIHGPENDFAVFVVHQRKGEDWFDKKQLSFHAELFPLIYHYYAAVKAQLDKNAVVEDDYHLTRREQQCLRLTAKNYVAKDIASSLNITERTVHYHMQNVNKKLGVKHKYQAVSKARELAMV